jgi:hypothetical protein
MMPGKAIIEKPRYTNINKQLEDEKPVQVVAPPPQAPPPQSRVAVSDGLRKNDLCRSIHEFVVEAGKETCSAYYRRQKYDWDMWIIKKKEKGLFKNTYPGELILADWPPGNLSNWQRGEWLLEVYGDENMQEMTELARQLEEHFHVRVNIRLKQHTPLKRRPNYDY